MRHDLIPEQSEFDAMSSPDKIDALCAVYGCKEKAQKIHYQAFVHKQWNPHPPMRFVFWWAHGGAAYTETKSDRSWIGIDAVRAFNCEAVREAYFEAKSVGLVKPVPGKYEPIAREVIGA